MAHCCITLGHSTEDRTWIIIVRLIGDSCTALRTEHHSSRKGHTGGVPILSGNKQSTLCLHAHVLDTAPMHRGRHLKACRESLPALLMFLSFATGTFSFLPAKELKFNLRALSVSVHAQLAERKPRALCWGHCKSCGDAAHTSSALLMCRASWAISTSTT